MAASERLGVYTTIFPAVRGYLREWYRSLSQQTDRNFELWIGLDAMEAEEVKRIIGCEPDAHWLDSPKGSTPAQIRQMALSQMAAECTGVVLVDSDDLLEPTRVDAARAQMRSCELGGCALRLVDECGDDLNLTFDLPTNIEPEQVFPRCNVFGFSNSVFDSRLLSRVLPIPNEAVLVDWFLSTRAWLLGSKMDFDRVPHMKYRQYPGTMAHVRHPFSAQHVKAHTKMVLHHFKLVLAAPLQHRIEDRYQALVNTQKEIERFRQKVVAEETKLALYVKALNALSPAPIWWTSVAYPSLQSMWS